MAAGQGGEPARNPAVRGLAGWARGVAGSEPSGAPRVRDGGAEDQGADDARFNLELLLTLLRPGGGLGRDLREDQNGTASGVGAGLAVPKVGYGPSSSRLPWAGLVALTAVVPVAAWVTGARRSASVRRSIGLGPPPRRGSVLLLGALVLAIALLGLAAAQPVVASSHRSAVRRDADVFIVLDTSRSMLASRAPETPTRFDRARSDRPRVGQGAPGRGRRDRLRDRSGPAAPLSDRKSSRLRGHARRCDRRSATASCRGHAGERNRPRLTRRTCPGALLPAGRACACRGCPDRRRVPRLPVPTRGDRSAAGEDPARADPARECERARIRPIGAAGGLPAGAGNRRRVPRTALLLRASAYAEPEAQAAIAEVARAVARGGGVARHSTTSVRDLRCRSPFTALLPVLFLLWRRNVR